MKKKNFCSFYVSEYHLLTILLPYIDEQISNSKNVRLILEEDMIESVKKYLKRYEINNMSKIIKLGWKKEIEDKIEISENIDNVIICGHETFVKKINREISKFERNVELVKCYNVDSLNNLNEVARENDFVLRTNGLCEIKKSSHNEQKRKTIQTQI